MEFKEIKTKEDFESIKKGDWLACEFKEPMRYDYPEKPYTFKIFKVHANLERAKEIVLQRKNNMYFNYEMFLRGESYLKQAVLIQPTQALGKEVQDEKD